MTRKIKERIIGEVVNEIVRLVNPQKIVLFGSSAKNTAAVTGDLDFLVVVPDRRDLNDTMDKLNLGVTQRTLPCDFVVATSSMIKKYRNTPGLIYREAMSSGIELYVA